MDLRQTYSKQKKQLLESNTELAHSSRRAEQYEQEVKKLRSRIEELKDDLITAENEVSVLINDLYKPQNYIHTVNNSIIYSISAGEFIYQPT